MTQSVNIAPVRVTVSGDVGGRADVTQVVAAVGSCRRRQIRHSTVAVHRWVCCNDQVSVHGAVDAACGGVLSPSRTDRRSSVNSAVQSVAIQSRFTARRLHSTLRVRVCIQQIAAFTFRVYTQYDCGRQPLLPLLFRPRR